MALRKTLQVSLDDLLAVVREFLNPNVSRSGLDRCLCRNGVGNLHDPQAKPTRPKHSAFKAYMPGYIHIDVKYLPHLAGEREHSPVRRRMADESRRRYLFVAIDPLPGRRMQSNTERGATRWVFIRIFQPRRQQMPAT